jgi:hypothetical protein
MEVPMNLKQSRQKDGRVYLSIEKGYRDKTTGKPKAKTVKSLGYLDILEKEFADPIAHFKEVARLMTEEEKAQNKLTLSINMGEKLSAGTDSRKNFGYAAVLKIYHELGLDLFFKNKSRHEHFQYNTNSIMIMLVVSRLLCPGSKKKAFEEKERYFERFNFSLADLYRSLSHFSKVATEFQRYLNAQITEKYGRNTKTIYYDVTNYYFEIDEGDEFRKLGLSKEKRRDPIVQMGLALDADGIPLHYELFPGNTVDKETFRPVIGEIRRNYDTGRIIVVADMGVITGDNIFYLQGKEKGRNFNGYVFSFSVRGGTRVFKNYVLCICMPGIPVKYITFEYLFFEATGYQTFGNGFRLTCRLYRFRHDRIICLGLSLARTEWSSNSEPDKCDTIYSPILTAQRGMNDACAKNYYFPGEISACRQLSLQSSSPEYNQGIGV